jgi:hypothetical protein
MVDVAKFDPDKFVEAEATNTAERLEPKAARVFEQVASIEKEPPVLQGDALAGLKGEALMAAARKQVAIMDATNPKPTMSDAQDLKTRLNALNWMVPVVQAIELRPGYGGTVGEKAIAVSSMLKAVFIEAARFARIIAPSKANDKWIRGSISKTLSEVISTQWVKKGNTNVDAFYEVAKLVMDSDEIEQLAPSLKELNTYPASRRPDDDKAKFRLTLLNAVDEVHEVVSNFSFYQDPRDLLTRLVTFAVNLAGNQNNEYLDISRELRLSTIQSYTKHATKLMVTEYRKQSTATIDRLLAAAEGSREQFEASKQAVVTEADATIGGIEQTTRLAFSDLLFSVEKIVEREACGAWADRIRLLGNQNAK